MGAFGVFSREEKLIKAVMDNDVANTKRLLRKSGVRSRIECVFSRFCSDRPNNSSLLHLAAYSNSVEVARLLIQGGGEVNLQNGVGDTSLHVAARYNAWETADLLISCGAELHISNHAAQTPLDIAIDNGNLNLAELLILAAKHACL